METIIGIFFVTICHLLDQPGLNEAIQESLQMKQEQTPPIPQRKHLGAPPALPPKVNILNTQSRQFCLPTYKNSHNGVDDEPYSSSNGTVTISEKGSETTSS